MLSIRMQRTGRKGHAMFRMVVQDSRLTPTSGKVVARLGSYDPHTKAVTVDSEKATFYLSNGAQPSDRAALLLQKEGVELPKWVKLPAAKNRTIRNPEKLRRNLPKETPEEKAPESTAEDTAEVASEAPAAEATETATAEAAPADAPEAETGTTES